MFISPLRLLLSAAVLPAMSVAATATLTPLLERYAERDNTPYARHFAADDDIYDAMAPSATLRQDETLPPYTCSPRLLYAIYAEMLYALRVSPYGFRHCHASHAVDADAAMPPIHASPR